MRKSTIILWCAIGLFGCTSKPEEQPKQEPIAKENIIEHIQDISDLENIEVAKKQPLVLQQSSDYLLIKNGNQYLYVDLRGEYASAYALDKVKSTETVITHIYDHGYVVQHGDHEHYIEGQPPQGAKVGDTIIQKNLHDEEEEKHEPTSKIDDGYIFDEKDIVKQTEDGYIVRHGDHFHFIEKGDVPDHPQKAAPKTSIEQHQPVVVNSKVEEKPKGIAGIDYSTDDGFLFVDQPYTKISSGIIVEHNGHQHFLRKEDLLQTKWKTIFESSNPVEQPVVQLGEKPDEHETVQPIIDEEDTKPIDETKPEVQIDLEIQKKKAYLAAFYEIQEDQIQVDGEYFIIPHGDHFHSLAIKDVIVPEMTGDLEADFIKELDAFLMRMHVSEKDVLIQDGYFKVVHGDHTHDYKIQSPGWRLYVKNQIPEIHTTYISGSFDRETVLNRVEEILASAKQIYGEESKTYRRIVTVIDALRQDIDYQTNSTEGFLKALDEFDEKYVTKQKKPETPKTPTISYAGIQELIQTLKTKYQDHPEVLAQIESIEQEFYFSSASSYPNIYERLMALDQPTEEKEETITTYQQLDQKIREMIESGSLSQEQNEKLERLQIDVMWQADSLEHLVEKYQGIVNVPSQPEKSSLDELYDQTYHAILDLEDSGQIAKKVRLLDRLYELEKTEENRAQFEMLLQEALQDEQPKETEDVQQLREYILLNVNSVKLTEDQREEIQAQFEHAANLEDYQAIKQQMKEYFKTYDEEIERLNGLFVQRVSELKKQHADHQDILDQIAKIEEKVQLHPENIRDYYNEIIQLQA